MQTTEEDAEKISANGETGRLKEISKESKMELKRHLRIIKVEINDLKRENQKLRIY